MFQAQVDVIGVTTTPEETMYAVVVNGIPFSFRDDEQLRIGIQMIRGMPMPIRMPVLDPKNPSLLVAFVLDPRDAQKMVDEGLSLRFVAHPAPRPMISES